AVLAWFLWRDNQSFRWLCCCGLCAGFAVSFKLTALPVPLALCALTTWQIVRNRVAARRVVAELGVFLLISIAPLAPWLVKAWTQTGNPVWPHYSSVFPTRDWTPEAAKLWERGYALV